MKKILKIFPSEIVVTIIGLVAYIVYSLWEKYLEYGFLSSEELVIGLIGYILVVYASVWEWTYERKDWGESIGIDVFILSIGIRLTFCVLIITYFFQGFLLVPIMAVKVSIRVYDLFKYVKGRKNKTNFSGFPRWN